MKYCRKCGNQMDDNMAFCQKCGTKAEEADAKHGESTMDYSQFWGLRYKDSESKNEIELTPQGVHIFNSAGTKGNQFNKLIRYKHRLTRAHREKQLKMSCQALHNAPPNRT